MKRIYTLLLTLTSVAAFAVSPYINKVYEYVPAPGQFINTLPKFEAGDTEADMLNKVSTALVGKGSNGTMICLGAFGGYITVGFDHPIVNLEGVPDFLVYGNSYTGNAEPGVIMVMKDENGNGKPDDTWYEIAGSAYNNASTIVDYEITYYKPSADADAATTAIDKYIHWRDNQGGEGYIPKNKFHTQPYYPQWIAAESYTLKGTKLPANATLDGTTWKLPAFDYGYADNLSNNDENAKIDIALAVDANGDPANLDQIDFIRIHTAENQVCGCIGETSTEVVGVEDLHPDIIGAIETTEAISYILNPFSNEIVIRANKAGTVTLYNLCGKCELTTTIEEGLNRIASSHLHKGTYILKTENKTYKIIKL